MESEECTTDGLQVSGCPAMKAPAADRMLDPLIADHVPDAVGIVLYGDDTPRAQAEELSDAAITHLSAQRQRVTDVRTALDAAPTATAQAELQLRVPAQKVLLVVGKRRRIGSGEFCELFPYQVAGIEHGRSEFALQISRTVRDAGALGLNPIDQVHPISCRLHAAYLSSTWRMVQERGHSRSDCE
jgi:hypothetical protein